MKREYGIRSPPKAVEKIFIVKGVRSEKELHLCEETPKEIEF